MISGCETTSAGRRSTADGPEDGKNLGPPRSHHPPARLGETPSHVLLAHRGGYTAECYAATQGLGRFNLQHSRPAALETGALAFPFRVDRPHRRDVVALADPAFQPLLVQSSERVAVQGYAEACTSRNR